LLYYHARYYDPTLARFVSADSVVPGQADTAGTANPQELNRYSYVNNNPLKYTDPSGHVNQIGQDKDGPMGGGGGGPVEPIAEPIAEPVEAAPATTQIGPESVGEVLSEPMQSPAVQAKSEEAGIAGPQQPSRGLVENPDRPGSWGKYDSSKIGDDGNPKFREYWRQDTPEPGADPKTWVGKAHVHYYGQKAHLSPDTPFDPEAPYAGNKR